MATDTMAARVLSVLEVGPAAAVEVAAELDCSPRLASAHLCWLRTCGLVRHKRRVPGLRRWAWEYERAPEPDHPAPFGRMKRFI
jgi:predicted ArsR family transcriptional regulator